MAKNKTVQTDANVDDYLLAIEDPVRRSDCLELSKMMAKVSKHPPKMWGEAIVGFGTRHYVYDSGREGDICLIGFSSRKAAITLYLPDFPQKDQLLPSLSGGKSTKGCLYIKRLGDIDRKLLKKILECSIDRVSEQ